MKVKAKVKVNCKNEYDRSDETKNDLRVSEQIEKNLPQAIVTLSLLSLPSTLTLTGGLGSPARVVNVTTPLGLLSPATLREYT